MRKIVNCLLMLFLIVSISKTAIPSETKKAKDIVIEPPLSILPEYEKLTYTVRWLGLPVGTIIASIKQAEKMRGRDCYVLEVTVNTNDFCSSIYKIDDRFISYMDKECHYTLRHEVCRREGRYKKDAVTDFDHEKRKAYFKNTLDKSEKEIDIPSGVQDTLSACYYFRLLPLNLGKSVEYTVYNNEANYQLFGVIESKEVIRVPKLGKKEVFYVQPYAKLKGEEVKKGKVSGYFSCDEKRMPLIAVVKGPVFTEVIAYLSKIEYRQDSK